MKKKILILGVTGQDGSLLAEFLINKNYLVYGLIRKSSNRNLDNLKTIINHKNFKLVQGDILDIFSIEKIIKQIQPNEIYNFADQDHVSWSYQIPTYSFDVTAFSVLKILDKTNGEFCLKGINILSLFLSDWYRSPQLSWCPLSFPLSWL